MKKVQFAMANKRMQDNAELATRVWNKDAIAASVPGGLREVVQVLGGLAETDFQIQGHGLEEHLDVSKEEWCVKGRC